MTPLSPESDRLILGALPADEIGAGADRARRLVFWINAYNTLVAAGLAALGVRRTVWDVPNLFARISYRVGGLVWSADEIEHGVLRGNRSSPLAAAPPFAPGDPRLAHAIVPMDPRIHFAISCGARSCPPARVYGAGRVEELLDGATRDYVNREVARHGGRLVVSGFFRWFAADFADSHDSLAGFLAAYLADGPVRRAVLEGGLADVVWRPYDWRLPAPPGRARA